MWAAEKILIQKSSLSKWSLASLFQAPLLTDPVPLPAPGTPFPYLGPAYILFSEPPALFSSRSSGRRMNEPTDVLAEPQAGVLSSL